jgi:hypothetical protein
MRHKPESRGRFSTRWGIALAAIVGAAVFSTPALAKNKSGGKRIAVLPPIDGTPKDAIITAKISAALKKHKIQVKAPRSKGSLPSTDGDWIDLARKLRVDGLVESTLSQSGGKRRVEVAVHTGADGSVARREIFTAKGPPAKLAAAVTRGFWNKLGSAIKDTSPPKRDEDSAGPLARSSPPTEMPTPPAPQAAPQNPENEENAGPETDAARQPDGEEGEKSETVPPVRKRSAQAKADPTTSPGEPRSVEVEVGFRALQRVFDYEGAAAGRSYVKHFIPTFEGRAAWFPVTYAGLFGSVEFNPAFTTGSNPSYPTGTRELIVGAQGRYPLSFGLVGFSAAFFQHMFVIMDSSNANDAARSGLDWPDVAYQGARFAASGRFFLGDLVQVGAEAAYRLVTSPGEGGARVRSSYYFPNGKATYGLDGMVFVSLGVVSWLELRAAVDYRQYRFGVLAPGADNVGALNASGASDRYLGFSLGAVGVYGGK